ncbi:hypothetical protein F4777DRAFT_555000 [Nemania sp. FL0916]|nr:hypothetical protein F4777DRAFT_555000 [Nemania sp. FL0916]
MSFRPSLWEMTRLQPVTLVSAIYGDDGNLQETVISGPKLSYVHGSFGLPEDGVYIINRNRAFQIAAACDHRRCNVTQICHCTAQQHMAGDAVVMGRGWGCGGTTSTDTTTSFDTATSNGRSGSPLAKMVELKPPTHLINRLLIHKLGSRFVRSWLRLDEAAQAIRRLGLCALANARTLSWDDGNVFGTCGFYHDTELDEHYATMRSCRLPASFGSTYPASASTHTSTSAYTYTSASGVTADCVMQGTKICPESQVELIMDMWHEFIDNREHATAIVAFKSDVLTLRSEDITPDMYGCKYKYKLKHEQEDAEEKEDEEPYEDLSSYASSDTAHWDSDSLSESESEPECWNEKRGEEWKWDPGRGYGYRDRSRYTGGSGRDSASEELEKDMEEWDDVDVLVPEPTINNGNSHDQDRQIQQAMQQLQLRLQQHKDKQQREETKDEAETDDGDIDISGFDLMDDLLETDEFQSLQIKRTPSPRAPSPIPVQLRPLSPDMIMAPPPTRRHSITSTSTLIPTSTHMSLGLNDGEKPNAEADASKDLKTGTAGTNTAGGVTSSFNSDAWARLLTVMKGGKNRPISFGAFRTAGHNKNDNTWNNSASYHFDFDIVSQA